MCRLTPASAMRPGTGPAAVFPCPKLQCSRPQESPEHWVGTTIQEKWMEWGCLCNVGGVCQEWVHCVLRAAMGRMQQWAMCTILTFMECCVQERIIEE